MLKKNNVMPTTDRVATSTIIGEGITIKSATLAGAGNVRIDGSFSGVVELEGHLIVGSTGVVEGDVSATSALIAGEVTGNLIVTKTTHLATTAKVTAKLQTNKMIMDEDAIFNGQSIMLPLEEGKVKQEVKKEEPKKIETK